MKDDIIDNGSFIITSEHGAVPVFGHDAKWRISSNEVEYADCIRFCQNENINTSLVPPPRCGNDAFALATSIFDNRSKEKISSVEDWDGNTCMETWKVRALTRGREYALIRERLGKKNGRRHLEQTPVYRLEYVPGGSQLTTEEWRTNYMLRAQGITQVQTEDGTTTPVGPANDEALRTRVRISPYSPDTGIEDVDAHLEMVRKLQDRFVELSKAVDEVLLRNKLRNLLVSHRAVPDATVKGGIHQIANEIPTENLTKEAVQPHILTLRPFAKLLRFWGNTNRPDALDDNATWADEEGSRIDYRTRGNLTLVPRVKTEELIDEMANNVEHQLNIAFGELYENIRSLLCDLSTETLQDEKKAEKEQERLRKRAEKFQQESQKLHDAVQRFEKQLGRSLDIRKTPYKDQQSDLDARLAAIRTVDEVTAQRFLNMIQSNPTPVETPDDEEGGFDGLGSLFGAPKKDKTTESKPKKTSSKKGIGFDGLGSLFG